MKILAIILYILLITTISSAAPSIGNVSGTFSHGNSIIITGSGFGTKSPARPYVWADFESLSVGDDPSANSEYSSGSIAGNGGNSYPLVTNADLPHPRSTKSVRGIPYDGTKNAARLYSNLGGANKVYVFMRRKFASSTWFNKVTNYKYWRLWPSNGDQIDEVVVFHNYSAPFVYPYGNMGTRVSVEGGTPAIAYQDVFTHPPNNQWNIEEYLTSKSSLNASDGVFKMWMNGAKAFSESVMNRTTGYNSSGFDQLSLENFWTNSAGAEGLDNPPLNGYVYYDDVYIDTTWARVMIGNASTYDACTHREPLIPTAWGNGSITAYFNQGSFSNGQSVYLFVVDSNGNTSPGKTITIGGAADLINKPTPSPPTNLNIK